MTEEKKIQMINHIDTECELIKEQIKNNSEMSMQEAVGKLSIFLDQLIEMA